MAAPGDKANPGKELYRRFRARSCRQLWEEEVPRFDQAAAKERTASVALIRAVGVVFSETGTASEKEQARAWLRGLLRDPEEKIRRYAMTALPKLGADAVDEAELLTLLAVTTAEREVKFLGRSLDKIGGAATLEALPQRSGWAQTEQKVKAAVARETAPSGLRMTSALAGTPGLRLHLRCRRGLEEIVREEVEAQGKFRVLRVEAGLVAVTCATPFTLGDVYALRCFTTVGFLLGDLKGAELEEVAAAMTAEVARQIFQTFTEGSIRYRIDFLAKGHQRGAVQRLANLVYARCPEILNDARDAPWTAAIYPTPRGSLVELTPRLRPDPRFAYRRDDVPAASHPPLAAGMARLAGPMRDEIVWDPFCGSGLELIETALRGGVRLLFGTDRNAGAIGIAEANFAAALPAGARASFACSDFRDFARGEALGPGGATLIITNPPMGKRVPVPSLRGLLADLFAVSARVLRPGGRLIFPNPMGFENPHPSLALDSRRVVDLGGFDCRLEVWRKVR